MSKLKATMIYYGSPTMREVVDDVLKDVRWLLIYGRNARRLGERPVVQ